jgi:cell shape-determining protein MreC
MPRSFARPQNTLPFTMVVCCALAFTPSGWLRWTSDLANVVNLPLTPFRDMGLALAERLRSPVGPAAASDAERTLLEERDELERQLHLASLRLRELEEQIEQLQHLPPDNTFGRTRPVAARITGRNVRSPLSAVEINRGERHEVVAGSIAVYGGVHLIGSVTSVEPLRSHVLPITNPSMGRIQGRLLPKSAPGTRITSGELVQLAQRGDGTLTAEVRTEHPVVAGDVVRLDDHEWPPAAQAMILGYVESVVRNDRQPLMNTVVVRPRYRIHELATIALQVPVDDDVVRIGGGGGSPR